jgi:Rrf2 family protein
MRMSDGVEWAIHCCTLLALLPPDTALPAIRLAEFHGVPPAYLAKQLQALSRAGIAEAVPGARGGYRLARPAGDITLLDVVHAVDGAEPAFRCTEIRQRGPAALDPCEYRASCSIARAMAGAEAAWRSALRAQTVGDIVRSLASSVHPEAAVKAAAWFQEVLR